MSKIVKKYKELLKCALLFLIGGALYYCIEILWRGHSHWTMAVVGGHRRIEQLYSVGNAHVEAGSCRCVICDWHGTCCGYPAESNAWFAYLGLFFPAIQSAWSNLSAIYCVMVLPCFVVHLCR